jgi:hypothetical protein
VQSLVFFRDEDAHLRELLARWTMAFPRVLMCHLREDMDVAKEVAVSAGIYCYCYCYCYCYNGTMSHI